jgi:hypothetical protein
MGVPAPFGGFKLVELALVDGLALLSCWTICRCFSTPGK